MTIETTDVYQAAQVLRDGGVIAYATEAVFGLGCNPRNAQALQKLLAIKQRAAAKGLILIASDEQQLHPYIDLTKLTESLWQPVRSSWPGPVTWILPANQTVSSLLCGEHDSLAVRVTAHPQVSALCEAFGGAIVSTSANLSDQEPARNAEEVKTQFSSSLDLILLGETGGANKPSEIRDALTGKIIRKA